MNNWIEAAKRRYLRGEFDIEEFERECERAIRAEEDADMVMPHYVDLENDRRGLNNDPGSVYIESTGELLTVQENFERAVARSGPKRITLIAMKAGHVPSHRQAKNWKIL